MVGKKRISYDLQEYYLAHKAKHQWLSFIDLSKISLGHGDSSVIKGGIYVSQFNISIPKELAEL